jgi:hypothetical protein
MSAPGQKVTLDVTSRPTREKAPHMPMPHGKVPCGSCASKPECRSGELACSDFAFFAEYGRTRLKDREPTREAFAKVFGV